MSWWGKLIGGAFGYMVGGPIGAIIGAALGHNFDTGLARIGYEPAGRPDFNEQERTQTAFFTATFSVMGHLAKVDGQVTKDELKVATDAMNQMGLTQEHKRFAQRLFTRGKAADFPLDDILDQFRRECRRSRNLVRIFLEILLQAAYANGVVSPAERRLLNHIGQRLGVPRHELDGLEAMIRAELNFRRARAGPAHRKPTVGDAYAILNLPSSASDAEVKRAYRRLMSQHHPDKLVAKGLPEEMMKIANEKTQEIKHAYEQIKEARGM